MSGAKARSRERSKGEAGVITDLAHIPSLFFHPFFVTFPSSFLCARSPDELSEFIVW